ncbi:hypothetical protein G9A89_019258 [Geosiphon pyriformis]|nr:hypothetical protein G9A89_019258 [Geosiphon pyriformis]
MLSVLDFETFFDVHNSLIKVWSNSIEVYTDEFLKSASSAKIASGMAAYFSAIDIDIEVKVYGLLFSTLAELQAIVLALICILSSCAVVLYLNSQFAIDVYVSETLFAMPSIHN